MAKIRKPIHPDDPLYHADHPRPVTRRDFIKQGFISGSAVTLGGGVFSLFSNPREAMAALAPDIEALATDSGCPLGALSGDQKIPFIAFDLGGGANLAASNVLVGQEGGQMDNLSTAGYSKLGLPGDMIPGLADTNFTLLNASNGNFVNNELGLAFHADSPMLMGILERAQSAVGDIDGAVIPARSDNDTGNNPHNPMYGIARAGAIGGVVNLIGSVSSESGARSMSPAALINPEIRPTKVDRPSDVTGMVDVGDLTAILNDPADITAVMESMARLSHKKLDKVSPGINVTRDKVIEDLVRCGYLKAADLADRFAGVTVDPDDRLDPADPSKRGVIVNDAGGIFTEDEFDNEREFRKTASVMKMVLDGHAGAGSITMGGYDYHTGNRFVGENRDLRAGRCIGACLEYAATRVDSDGNPDPVPVMIYVYSDGSVASNGMLDSSLPQGGNELGGRGKGQWTGDNSSTACSFFLVYNPTGNIPTYQASALRQIGRFDASGSVVNSATPAGNNVNILVNMVVANYMSLNGDLARFADADMFPNHGLGNIDSYISFGTLT